MREVLEYIQKNKEVTKEKLRRNFHKTEEEINSILKNLQQDLLIEKTKRETYEITEKENKKVGILSLNPRGYGFVAVNGKEIYVSKQNIHGALDKDTVLIDIFTDDQNREYGVVVKRKVEKHRIVGTIVEKNQQITVLFDNPRYQNLQILLNSMKGLYVDHKVVVETDGKTGEIVEILGHKNDPGMDILSIVKELNIESEFSEEVMNYVENIPTFVGEEECIGRKDLRKENIFTIDGKDAKDYDDAVGIKKLENGNYLLMVSIADVSYYVVEDSILDKTARSRGTSVYLADRVIPMLPHKLSNGICSLNEGVDRLAFTCEMEFDGKGNLVNYDIFESVINSKKRMKYHEVNEIFNGKDLEDYADFKESLFTMLELSKILRKKRDKRGSIAFDTNEIKIIVDENGKAIDVIEEVRGEAEKLIEDFMIASNETVASHASYMNIPFIYRIHDLPDSEKLKIAKELLYSMGYSFKTKGENISSKEIQKFLDFVKNKEDYDVIATILLRAMKKAVYSIYNDGHFALASFKYTHFTSPIRRYPDLAIHRTLKDLIKNQIDYDNIKKLASKLNNIALSSSENEQKAEECEREVDKLKSAEYLEDKIGTIYDGKIISLDEKGMYVKLKNQIEGFISSKTLDGDFDEEQMCYKDHFGQKKYRLGMPLKVKLVRTDKTYRTIDFEVEKVKVIKNKNV